MADIDAPAIPILETTDIVRTVAFYAALGFEEQARWDDYLILRRQQAELHFSLGRRRRHSAGCYIRISEAPSLHAEWTRVATAKVSALQATDYGLVEFALHDPDGNQIRVGSPDASAASPER